MRREEYLSDPEETQILMQQALQAKLWTALPGIVTEVDYTKFTVSVQPAIKGQSEDADGKVTEEQLPVLVDVPIVFPNAGGWHMTYPIAVGDEVLVVFSSRCIDAWWQSGGVQKAMEKRMHDLSDGFAIPAPYSQPLAAEHVGGFSNNSVIIRDDKKENFIEFVTGGNVNVLHQKDLDWDTLGNADIYVKGNVNILVDGNVTGHVKGNVTTTIDGTLESTIVGDVSITAQSNVTATITGNMSADIGGNLSASVGGSTSVDSAGAITLKAPSITLDAPTVTCTGNVSISGNMAAGGSGTVDGSMDVTGDVTGAGISLSSHVHGGVESGPATTGGPQ